MGRPRMPTEELRPLVHGFAAERDGELVFRSAAREVAIGGDVGFIREVLSSCDGRRTVAEIAAQLDANPTEVGELVAALTEQDVVTDCGLAWRNFHRQSSARSGLFRELGEVEVLELMQERFRPRHEQSFHELSPRGGALGELTARRNSARPEGGERAATFEELSSLLVVMYGDPDGVRPIPSGGGIYPLALHVLVRRPIEALDPGLWWYEPGRGLWLVRGGDLGTDGLFISNPLTDELISFGHPIVFISADLERPTRKYGNRAYRHALTEVGAAMQNAYLIGAELELPVRAFAGIVEDAVDEFLELPRDAHALLAILIGN